MEVIDLNEKYYSPYFMCLEEWSDEIREAGNHKESWFNKFKSKGLRVKIAVEQDKVCGMIQYLPEEPSVTGSPGIYFIKCIWVHGHKQGIGNFQKRGIGTRLLKAAEEDVKSLSGKGIAAWGISLPFWMKASWFKKKGYKKIDKNGMAVLLWKPFYDDVVPPKWVKEKKKPENIDGKVAVTSFINGWCPAMNMIHERGKRAAAEIGDRVVFREIMTDDRHIIDEWGITDGLFVDGKRVGSGPPPSYKKIKKIIQKRADRIPVEIRK